VLTTPCLLFLNPLTDFIAVNRHRGISLEAKSHLCAADFDNYDSARAADNDRFVALPRKD